MNRKIIILGGKGQSTRVLYFALRDEFKITKVVLEEGISRVEFIKKRIKKLGFFKVLDQVFFQLLVIPFLTFEARKRIQEIFQIQGFVDSAIPSEIVSRVFSVNSEECRHVLKMEQPDIIIVNGTRIINKLTLSVSKALIVNTHAGITPKYRGVHGGYWALANNDSINCGVTIHKVDVGIDTGGILARGNIHPSSSDNFVTYPLLQLAAGILLLRSFLLEMQEGKKPKELDSDLESTLWSHPGAFEYIVIRLFKKVK